MVLVPFGPLRWYRLVRYDGTDCSATVVPIRPLRWYRLTDTINKGQLTLYLAEYYVDFICYSNLLLIWRNANN